MESTVRSVAEKVLMQGGPADATRLLLLASSLCEKVREGGGGRGGGGSGVHAASASKDFFGLPNLALLKNIGRSVLTLEMTNVVSYDKLGVDSRDNYAREVKHHTLFNMASK